MFKCLGSVLTGNGKSGTEIRTSIRGLLKAKESMKNRDISVEPKEKEVKDYVI